MVNEYDPENLNLSNFIINRYIQLAKYKNNKYFYTENFKNTFNVIICFIIEWLIIDTQKRNKSLHL